LGPPLLSQSPTGFPRDLGSANPCTIAVDMEPFSNFDLQAKVFHLNNCYYHQHLHWGLFHLRSPERGFSTTPTPESSYSSGAYNGNVVLLYIYMGTLPFNESYSWWGWVLKPRGLFPPFLSRGVVKCLGYHLKKTSPLFLLLLLSKGSLAFLP